MILICIASAKKEEGKTLKEKYTFYQGDGTLQKNLNLNFQKKAHERRKHVNPFCDKKINTLVCMFVNY